MYVRKKSGINFIIILVTGSKFKETEQSCKQVDIYQLILSTCTTYKGNF